MRGCGDLLYLRPVCVESILKLFFIFFSLCELKLKYNFLCGSRPFSFSTNHTNRRILHYIFTTTEYNESLFPCLCLCLQIYCVNIFFFSVCFSECKLLFVDKKKQTKNRWKSLEFTVDNGGFVHHTLLMTHNYQIFCIRMKSSSIGIRWR